MTPSRTIGNASRALHPIGSALTDCATLLAEIRDELPKRGRLVDLHLELVTTLTHIEATYRNADEALTAAYIELEHAERCEREGWTPRPLGTPPEQVECRPHDPDSRPAHSATPGRA